MFARLLLLFILIPVLELFLFLVIGQRIGIPMTLVIIVATAFLGAYLTKSQGLKALARYQESIAQGRLPHEAIVDSLLILIAGAMLLTPGFLTDSLGFALLVPSVRQVIRQILEASLRNRFSVVGRNMGASAPRDNESARVITVEAEIVDVSTERSKNDHS